jgi:hypothetical protein
MLSGLLLILAVGGDPQKPLIELGTGGGMPGQTRFRVTVTVDGRLDVWRESLPIVRGGLTKEKRSIKLDGIAGQRLVQLARESTDFSQGCDQVGDGTDAVLLVRTNGQESRRQCLNADRWPVGPKTKRFLDELNSHLPKKWQVF